MKEPVVRSTTGTTGSPVHGCRCWRSISDLLGRSSDPDAVALMARAP